MYNYLNDAMNLGDKFRKATDYKICSSEKKNDIDRATICGKCYQDPDIVSEKLYHDLCIVFNNSGFSDFGKKHNLIETGRSSKWYLQFVDEYSRDEYNHELSSDYIGPSRAYALRFLKESKEEKAEKIGEFLLVSRTIGGHVFWPAHQVNRQHTINQVRGGRGIWDRIDITLAELQNFFKGGKTGKYSQALYNAFGRYQWFFDDCFGKGEEGFQKYIEYMMLDDFFDKEEKKVISLLESDLTKPDDAIRIPVDEENSIGYKPNDYIRYIDNCIELIKKRSYKMNEIIGGNSKQ